MTRPDKIHSFLPLFLAIILFCLAVTLFNSDEKKLLLEGLSLKWNSQSQSSRLMENADLVSLQNLALEQSDLYYLYNSSHLTTLDIPSHPSYFFQDKKVFLVGGGGHQNIINALNIAALGKQLEGKKLVFILSGQWFENQRGIPSYYFKRWFSSLQTFELLNNPYLSRDLKLEIANRLLEFVETRKDFTLYLKLQAFIHQYDFLDKLISKLVEAEHQMLLQKEMEKADKILSDHSQLARIKDSDQFNISTSRQDMIQAAETIARNASLHNEFYISDHYYDLHIKKKFEKLRQSKSHLFYDDTPEYGDLELLLKCLKELKAQALFVVIPFHGKWSDYIGINSESRNKYYQLVSEMVNKYNFNLANFSNHEYDPYFLGDIMHVGWKGWIYVNEAIYNFYEKKNFTK